MDRVEMWASAEVKKLMPGGFLEDSDIKQMVQNLVMLVLRQNLKLKRRMRLWQQLAEVALC